MSISGDEILDLVAENPLRNDVVRGSVDLNGRPSVRSNSGGWNSTSFIIGVEVADRLIYYGIGSNLVNYLMGPLGQSTAAVAAAVNAWSGTASFLPLLGASVADSFLGRYRVIIISSLLYALGLGVLSLSATLLSSRGCQNVGKKTGCSVPQFHIFFFYASLYIVALGVGGHKPCCQAFGADQFDEEDQKEREAKSSFFNWWYFCICASITVGILGFNYIQDNLSWGLSFGVACVVTCLALSLYLLGVRNYRFRIQIDEINPFVRIGRVFVAAVRCRRSKSIQAEHQGLLSHNNGQFHFLDRALYASNDSTGDGGVWNLGDVEEAKAILRLIPIWVTCLGYAIVYSQTSTFFTKQGVTMDRYITPNFQIPAASLLSFVSITIALFVPIYDCILVPHARAVTNKPSGISMLQRIGTGIFLSCLCMVVAALVEQKRLAAAAESPDAATVPTSVWWLAPQYMIFGIADVFAMVGLQELFYDQVSGELKSIGLAMCSSIIGIGGFLSSFLISVIQKVCNGWFSDNLNRAHLNYFYWLLAGLTALEFAAYVSKICYILHLPSKSYQLSSSLKTYNCHK